MANTERNIRKESDNYELEVTNSYHNKTIIVIRGKQFISKLTSQVNRQNFIVRDKRFISLDHKHDEPSRKQKRRIKQLEDAAHQEKV